MKIPTLTTPRLTLRPFTEADVEPLHRILNEDGILRYFPRPEPPDLARVQHLVGGQLQHWEEHGLGWWAVELRSTGELLGWNGLQYLPDTEEVEVGYLLSRRRWGQGLATEGAQAALRFGIETPRLGSIIGVVHPENIASQRVLEKAGLTLINEADYFGMHVCRYVTTADRHDAYTLSTDASKLDAGFIQDFLANSSYWAQNRSLAVTQKALANSLCFGVYSDTEQVGLARVVTDYATFAWVCDVFIAEAHRGHGLGKWLIERVVTHPDLRGLKQILLVTRDAHELYRRYGGFDGLPAPEKWMIRRKQ
jgi:RimJ/RimL family protein N-acetyltransferase/N-acetylglutamate synthase-like GNAT family acetyltransferase